MKQNVTVLSDIESLAEAKWPLLGLLGATMYNNKCHRGYLYTETSTYSTAGQAFHCRTLAFVQR